MRSAESTVKVLLLVTFGRSGKARVANAGTILGVWHAKSNNENNMVVRTRPSVAWWIR